MTERERDTSTKAKSYIYMSAIISFMIGSVIVIESGGVNLVFLVGLLLIIYPLAVALLAMAWRIAGGMDKGLSELMGEK